MAAMVAYFPTSADAHPGDGKHGTGEQPRSWAASGAAPLVVIGASNRLGSFGATGWRNQRADFFRPGRGINPNHAPLDGLKRPSRVTDLPQAPDLAVLCTPPGHGARPGIGSSPDKMLQGRCFRTRMRNVTALA